MKRIAFLFALAASAAAFGATVTKATFGNIGLNEKVVTDVDFTGLGSHEETDPTVPEWAKNPTPPLSEESDPHFNSFTNNGGTLYGPLKLHRNVFDYDYSTVLNTNGVTGWKFTPISGVTGYWVQWAFNWADLLTSESDPTVPSWAKAQSKPSYSWNEITGKPSFKTVATSGAYSDLTGKPSIPSTPADIGAASAAEVNSISQNVSTVIGYLQGDDAKVVVTNYDSAVTMPSQSLQQRINEGGSNYWKVVWNELTRWNRFTGDGFDWAAWCGFNCFRTNILAQLDEKADRAWGFYDSHTGNYAPDGYTWLSSPKIAIAAGLAYQRTITSQGAVWILESNGLVTETGGNVTNGFFKITDDEGNSIFSVVKGNKRTVGAQAGSVTTENIMGITHLYVTYNIVSESHPTLRICTDLSTGNWKAETANDCVANVSWTGSSGAYVADIWGKSAQSAMFVQGEYEVGGETYIQNSAPISVDGGILCTDGIHKVRPVYNNGSITWEVVQ